MQLGCIIQENDESFAGAIVGDEFVAFEDMPVLGELFLEEDIEEVARFLVKKSKMRFPLKSVTLTCPADIQEIWAAGVTYKRSKIAREEESAGAAQFYDKVYSAERPELFLKSPGGKCCGPNDLVRIRRDSKWNVPEPELALVINPENEIIGYTIGNDMSSRDIEGENPLYLPQAKIYTGSCSIGPVITLASAMPPLDQVEIAIHIDRDNKRAFEGKTSFREFNRKPEDLVEFLTRENDFPFGCILMTGTGIVPPDDFTLARGDLISISITGIGTLVNQVA
jgi:2-dehydro-3-deoxy-D-arabinonate dehydratase